MFGLFKKKDPIGKFWNWFQANENELRNFQSNPEQIVSPVFHNLTKIQNGLAIEFEPPKDNIINVTISASGDKNLFAIVQQIVEQAPKLDGWIFFAFRQKVPKDKVRGMVLKMDDFELCPDNMKFFPLPSGDVLDIIVYTTNITEENYNQVAYAGLMFIDNILGEYDCVTKVRSYDFQNMPTKQEELNDLKPLLDLAEYVDNFHKSKHN